MFSTKTGAARLTLAVVIGLIILKVVVAVITGSISIVAQAVDSFLDLFAVTVTFLSVFIAARPADDEHPFGHGKVENIAAIVQAALIFITGGLVIYSAVRRIITGVPIELAEAGIGVMLASILASFFLSRHLLKVSRTTDSMALEAVARNIAMDVYSAAAVLVGLVIVRFTRFNMLDPIIALAVSVLILKTGYEVMRKSLGGLVDTRLPEAEESEIKSCIVERYSQVVSFHGLRTRKAGSQRFVTLHLVMPKHASVEEAHRVCDHLEQDIETRLQSVSVTIHVEPCTIECGQCLVFSCTLRGSKD